MRCDDPLQEGERIMAICNSCRYCEGYCAVFPAMESRLRFGAGDLNYLANLCHNCGECYYACQFAPPHEFEVNVPAAFARIRARSYRKYSWPAVLGRAFANNGILVSLVCLLALIASVLGAAAMLGGDGLFSAIPGGDFYRVIPHRVLAATFGGVALFVLLALFMGWVAFWKDAGESLADSFAPSVIGRALGDALTLKNLHGAGEDCTYEGEELRTPWRRRFHHFTAYGFLLCFAATLTGSVYHYLLGREAPYSYISLPVALGALGGSGLLIGPAGLYWLRLRRDPVTHDPDQNGMDLAFIALLFLTSLTGMALLALRETAAMATLLFVHLGAVMALFLTLPYGKFVHAVYRFAALAKYSLERKRSGQNNGNDARGPLGPAMPAACELSIGDSGFAGLGDGDESRC